MILLCKSLGISGYISYAVNLYFYISNSFLVVRCSPNKSSTPLEDWARKTTLSPKTPVSIVNQELSSKKLNLYSFTLSIVQTLFVYVLLRYSV